jgi:hypothetical protein
MLTVLLVCAMCAGQSAEAISLRQKTPDSEGVLSNSLLIPPLASLLRSEVSELPPCQIATKAIETAAVGLEGYIVERISDAFTDCDLWRNAKSQKLNSCTKDSGGEYIRLTATSTDEATQSYYTDSECATTPKSLGTIRLGGCSSFGYSYVYSSTSAPPSTPPFVKYT